MEREGGEGEIGERERGGGGLEGEGWIDRGGGG